MATRLRGQNNSYKEVAKLQKYQMTLFSIGYATKPVAQLLAQLQSHQITAVADIRSVPYSKAFDDYHREALQHTLKREQIHYVYLGAELGPRSNDPAHYDESGQVQFHKLMCSGMFKAGVQRLQDGLDKGLNIALLCAEKDPAVCHRSLLVAYYLWHESGIETHHIGHEGTLETQGELERRLVTMHDLEADLFVEGKDLARLAYENQVAACAYRRSD